MPGLPLPDGVQCDIVVFAWPGRFSYLQALRPVIGGLCIQFFSASGLLGAGLGMESVQHPTVFFSATGSEKSGELKGGG